MWLVLGELELLGRWETRGTVCEDQLNATSACVGGFGRGMSYWRGLSGFVSFLPVAESASCANGTGVGCRGFLSAVKIMCKA